MTTKQGAYIHETQLGLLLSLCTRQSPRSLPIGSEG